MIKEKWDEKRRDSVFGEHRVRGFSSKRAKRGESFFVDKAPIMIPGLVKVEVFTIDNASAWATHVNGLPGKISSAADWDERESERERYGNRRK